MPNLINLTYARNNLSRVIEDVASKKKQYILIRDSVPQAVIIPYNQYQLEEEKWEDGFKKLMDNSNKRFRVYLKKKGIKYPQSEEKMYEIVDKISGRN